MRNRRDQGDRHVDTRASQRPPVGNEPLPGGRPITDGTTTTPAHPAQQTATSDQPTKKNDIGFYLIVIILTAVLLGGIGVLLYPTVADWWNRQHASRAVAGYVEQVDDMSAEHKALMLEQAHAFNQKLNTMPDRWHFTDEQMAEYNNTLDVTGTGIMGYITIPSIKVRLPIYHGTEETVLQIAGGHLAGSSLPVGGAATHSAVSGHTGLPSASLFTGLDGLKVGDTFAYHVLDETYTYQVDQIRVVLPNEMRDLDLDSNADYSTLITCTPYGINSHRLLVRGHRIANPVVSEDQTVYDQANRNQTTALGIAAAIIMLFIAWIISIMIRRAHEHRGTTPAKHSSE